MDVAAHEIPQLTSGPDMLPAEDGCCCGWSDAAGADAKLLLESGHLLHSAPSQPSTKEAAFAIDSGCRTIYCDNHAGGPVASEAPSMLRRSSTIEDAFAQMQAQASVDSMLGIEGTMRGRVYIVLRKSRNFDLAIAFIILLNAVYIGIETDHVQEADENHLAMPWYALEVMFVLIFIAEFALRLFVERWQFWSDSWNTFDFCLVLLATVDTLVVNLLFTSDSMLGITSVMRMVRILRLMRLLRILRLLRLCKELWLIAEGVLGAMRTLFWAWMLIFLMCYICSIFVTRTIGHEALDNEDAQVYFGTVFKSLFTLFQVLTVDDWVDIVNCASSVVTWARPVFCIFVVVSTFAVMNVVVAVMVAKIIESSLRHAEAQLKEVTEDWRKSTAKVREIFSAGDTDGNSELTKEEFFEALGRPDVMRFLHEVGVEVQRADSLFDVLDYDESGVLDSEEFVKGVMNARGGARSKDVLELHCELWRFGQTMKKEVDELREDAGKSLDFLSGEVASIRASVACLRQAAEPYLRPAR